MTRSLISTVRPLAVVTVLGLAVAENCEYFIDTIYGLPMHKPIKSEEKD